MELRDDLISRQAAIYAIEKRMDGITCEEFAEGMSEAITEISLLPSAQPEQKTGKWIEKEICETRRKEEMQVAKCSNCGKYLTTPHIYSFNHYNYCPHCGTKMGGEK